MSTTIKPYEDNLSDFQENFYNLRSNDFGSTLLSIKSFAHLTIDSSADNFLDVHIPTIISTNEFYCQLDDNDLILKEIRKEINIAKTDKILKDPVIGTACLAKYSVDELFYRGIVLNRLTPSVALIYFIDFGNTEQVNKIDLRPLSKELNDIPPQALRCSLKDVVCSNRILNKFTNGRRRATIKIVDVINNTLSVTLFEQDFLTKVERNVNEYLNKEDPISVGVQCNLLGDLKECILSETYSSSVSNGTRHCSSDSSYVEDSQTEQEIKPAEKLKVTMAYDKAKLSSKNILLRELGFDEERKNAAILMLYNGDLELSLKALLRLHRNCFDDSLPII